MNMSKTKFTAKDYLSQPILQESVQEENKTEIGNDFYWLTVRIDRSLSRPKKPYYWLKLLDTVYRQDLVGIKTADDYLESARYHAESPIFQGSDIDPLKYVYNLTDKEKQIFGTFLYLLKQTGNCYPSQNTIADWTGSSVSTVKRTINKLVNDGILDYKYRHNKTSIFRLPKKFFELPSLQSLANIYGFLKLSVCCLLSFNAANADELQYSTKIVKDIYKSQSSLRNSIVMSKKGTDMKTVTHSEPEYNKLTPEEQAWMYGESYLEPIRAIVPVVNAVPVAQTVDKIMAHNAQIKDNEQHSLPFSFSKEHWNQDKKHKQREYAQPKSEEPSSVISKRSIALRKEQPDNLGAGAYEHIAVKFFKYEAFLHTDAGKAALSLGIVSGNVHQQNFNDYLNESGDSYETAFQLFLAFAAL